MSEKDSIQKKETLSAPIRMDGEGEAEAIRDLTSEKFLNADDIEAAQIAAGVAKILKGELDDEFNRRLAKYMEWSEKRMEEERKYNENRMKWMEEQLDKANSLRAVSDFDKERVAVKAKEQAELARNLAMAEANEAVLKFHKKVANEPKVTVTSYGKPVRHRKQVKYEPEEISYVIGTKTFRWILPVGVPTELPKFVADEYNRRKLEEAKRNGLKQALNVENMQTFDKVAAKYPEIDPFRGANAMNGNDLLQTAKSSKEI